MDFRVFVTPYSNTTAGKWLDMTADDFDAEVDAISKNSTVEVFAADSEGFGGFRSESVVELTDLMNLALDKADPEAFIAYVNHVGGDLDDASRSFDDAFEGMHDSEEAFAEQLADDTMDIPSHLAAYFDYAKFARDLFLGDYFSIDTSGGVYVFRHV